MRGALSDEEEPFQRRTDHWDSAEAGGRPEDGGYLPVARDFGSDVYA